MASLASINDFLNVVVRVAGTSDDPASDESTEIAKMELQDMLDNQWEEFQDMILAFGVHPETNRLDGNAIVSALKMDREEFPMYKIKNRMDDRQHVICFDTILGMCDTICGGDDLEAWASQESADSDEVVIDVQDGVRHVGRVRVGSRLRDLHEILKAFGEYEVAATMEEQMLDLLKTRRDAVGENTSRLLEMQKKFRKCKDKSKIELEESRTRVQDQCAKSEEFGKNMESIFDERNATHDQHIDLIEKSDTAANVMINMQEKMLNNRKCACLIIDIRSCRRMFYCTFGLFIIFCLIDSLVKMTG
jgi:hypothetical protein|eukprot:g2082.t1